MQTEKKGQIAKRRKARKNAKRPVTGLRRKRSSPPGSIQMLVEAAQLHRDIQRLGKGDEELRSLYVGRRDSLRTKAHVLWGAEVVK